MAGHHVSYEKLYLKVNQCDDTGQCKGRYREILLMSLKKYTNLPETQPTRFCQRMSRLQSMVCFYLHTVAFDEHSSEPECTCTEKETDHVISANAKKTDVSPLF